MPVKPSQIGQDNNRKEIIDRACEIIDKTILNASKRTKQFFFDRSDLHIEYDDLYEIADIYKQQGWHTKVNSSQMEGSWVELSLFDTSNFINLRD